MDNENFLVFSFTERHHNQYWAENITYSADIKEAKVYNRSRNLMLFNMASESDNLSVIFLNSNKHLSKMKD